MINYFLDEQLMWERQRELEKEIGDSWNRGRSLSESWRRDSQQKPKAEGAVPITRMKARQAKSNSIEKQR